MNHPQKQLVGESAQMNHPQKQLVGESAQMNHPQKQLVGKSAQMNHPQKQLIGESVQMNHQQKHPVKESAQRFQIFTLLNRLEIHRAAYRDDNRETTALLFYVVCRIFLGQIQPGERFPRLIRCAGNHHIK